MKKIKLLVVGDAVRPTGFQRVLSSIIKYLPDIYEIHWLGVNYFGDPHGTSYFLYPASSGGDLYGLNRITSLIDGIKPDLVFMLNDIWILNPFLNKIFTTYKDKAPKVVVYFPADALEHDPSWYEFVPKTTAVVYNNFGLQVASKALPDYYFRIISHGICQDDFYKIPIDKRLIKGSLLPNEDKYLDSFIFLNASRNQERKRLDISMEAFAMFSKGKPENVFYYHHAGITDLHINAATLSKRLGIEDRLIVTDGTNGAQAVPISRLNSIYNACEVGLNSSLGEGFSLTNAEHAVTGAPQIVANHSALTELYGDGTGLMVEPTLPWTLSNIQTVGKIIKAEDMAEKMELIYSNQDLYNDLSTKSITKFSQPCFDWKVISSQWNDLFLNVINGG